MAITATKVVPSSAEIRPDAGGRLAEIWKLTHDNSATTVTITSDSIRTIEACLGTHASVVISNGATSSTAALTFAAALANGAIQYVKLIGQQ